MSDFEIPPAEQRSIQQQMLRQPANGPARELWTAKVRALVAHKIVCPFTGVVLDEGTVIVREDEDGFPVNVYSPEAWEQIAGSPTAAAVLIEGARHAGHQFRKPEERL